MPEKQDIRIWPGRNTNRPGIGVQPRHGLQLSQKNRQARNHPWRRAVTKWVGRCTPPAPGIQNAAPQKLRAARTTWDKTDVYANTLRKDPDREEPGAEGLVPILPVLSRFTNGEFLGIIIGRNLSSAYLFWMLTETIFSFKSVTK